MLFDKAYAIIHDTGKLLVGQGGKSGNSQTTRTGFHLPGGGRSGQEPPQQTALREIAEETGVAVGKLAPAGDPFTMKLGGKNVAFVVFKTDSVIELVSTRTMPKTSNSFDEPFASLSAITLDKCWNNANFGPKYFTDWFAQGLQEASTRGLLK